MFSLNKNSSSTKYISIQFANWSNESKRDFGQTTDQFDGVLVSKKRQALKE